MKRVNHEREKKRENCNKTTTMSTKGEMPVEQKTKKNKTRIEKETKKIIH